MRSCEFGKSAGKVAGRRNRTKLPCISSYVAMDRTLNEPSSQDGNKKSDGVIDADAGSRKPKRPALAIVYRKYPPVTFVPHVPIDLESALQKSLRWRDEAIQQWREDMALRAQVGIMGLGTDPVRTLFPEPTPPLESTPQAPASDLAAQALVDDFFEAIESQSERVRLWEFFRNMLWGPSAVPPVKTVPRVAGIKDGPSRTPQPVKRKTLTRATGKMT